MPTINQLTTASTSELDGDFEVVINTTDNKTRKAAMSDVKSRQFCDIQCTSLTIATADVLKLNVTPLEIVAAQGAGTLIVPVSAQMEMTFNSVAYATNTTLVLGHNTAALGIMSNSTLNSTISNITNFDTWIAPTAVNTQMIANQALQVSVATGNPTAGDSDITVHLTYMVITL